jgi:hypothetical protein
VMPCAVLIDTRMRSDPYKYRKLIALVKAC